MDKYKYMTITIKGEDLDCVKKAITIINNNIYQDGGIISKYNMQLLNALLGDDWVFRYEIGKMFISDDK